MKILLPYPNYHLSARVMDTEDLLNQMHDIETALSVLHQTDEEAADALWNEQVIQAWRGFEAQLSEYGLVIADEIDARTYSIVTTCSLCQNRLAGHRESLTHHMISAESGGLLAPPWMGNVNLHTSHKSELLRIRPDYYEPFFEHVRNDVPVQWLPLDAS